MTIVLASRNKHKINEFKQLLKDVEILSLDDIGFFEDIEENGKTCEENAEIKTSCIRKFLNKKGLDYFVVADDSGLFVNSLGGDPGVNSARYAGNHEDESNRQKLLNELKGKDDRSAFFKCVISFDDGKNTNLFVGETFGKITKEKIGDESFGYDCLFFSNDLQKTFGESSSEEKGRVSHRARAIEKFVSYLNKIEK